MQDLPGIFHAGKRISFFPGWSSPEAETSYIHFDAPIEIGGVTETGLVLHGGCISNRPNCHVSFELRISKSPGRRSLPLDRLDWRSLEGGHSNPRRTNNRLSGIRVSETHLHDFELNYSAASQTINAGKLRIAREVEEPIETFEELRTYVGNHLRINNIELVTEPDWVYSLFDGGFGNG